MREIYFCDVERMKVVAPDCNAIDIVQMKKAEILQEIALPFLVSRLNNQNLRYQRSENNQAS